MLVIVDDKTDTTSICGLEWADVFLISNLLLVRWFETKNPLIKKQADQLLVAFESAARDIIESTDNIGRIHEEENRDA